MAKLGSLNEQSFLRIVFQNADLQLTMYRAVRDALESALAASGVGEVAGRGSGPNHWSIQVEVYDLERGLEVIRRTLRGFGCPTNAKIHQHRTPAIVHRVN